MLLWVWINLKLTLVFCTGRHECLKDGKPIPRALGGTEPEMEVDQFGWRPVREVERDSSMDFVTTSLRRDCEDMGKEDHGYTWDVETAQCMYWNEPIPAEEQHERFRPLQFKYADLKTDCEQRGPEYKWVEAEVDGDVGSCYKWNEKQEHSPEDEPPKMVGPTEFLYQDLKQECVRRGWVWEQGPEGARRCTPFGTDTTDQFGLHQEPLLPSKPDRTPPTVVGDKMLDYTFTDLTNTCTQMGGVVHYLEDPPRAWCLSQNGCTVADQYGSYLDCERAGMENFLGEISIAGKQALKRDAFNPDGSQVVDASRLHLVLAPGTDMLSWLLPRETRKSPYKCT